MAPAFLYRVLSVLVSVFPVSLRVKFWRRLMHAGGLRWGRESIAQRMPGGLYLKSSSLIRVSEGHALHFVNTHTDLPVPVVVDCFRYGGITYLVMSRMPGHNLDSVYSQITPEIEHHLSVQLSRLLAPLRAIPAPSNAVCGWDGGPVYCERIRMGGDAAGPWESVEAFHKHLVWRAGNFIHPTTESKSAEEIQDIIRRAHARTHRICLTHNDLGSHNVLVDDDFNITGIIDWENCAWMPEYWELTKGTYLPQNRAGCWHRIMSAAFPMYALEQEAEHYIINYRTCYH